MENILAVTYRLPWRRQWHPTPVLLPGKSHGQRSLVGYSPWGRKEWSNFTSLSSVKYSQEKIAFQVFHFNFSEHQFSSVAQSCPTLCDPMKHSMPGLPVHRQLPEFTQTHVHRVSDAIQPSHPLSSPSPPAPNPSQHQSLFR